MSSTAINPSTKILDIEDIHQECARGCQFNSVTKRAVELVAKKLADKDKFLKMTLQKIVDVKEESKQRGLELQQSQEAFRRWELILEQNQRQLEENQKELVQSRNERRRLELRIKQNQVQLEQDQKERRRLELVVKQNQVQFEQDQKERQSLKLMVENQKEKIDSLTHRLDLTTKELETLRESDNEIRKELKDMKWIIGVEKLVCLFHERLRRGNLKATRNSIAHIDHIKAQYDLMREEEKVDFLTHVRDYLETKGEIVYEDVSKTLFLDKYLEIDIEELKNSINDAIDSMSKKK